jgi:hypothetical protein
MNNNNRIEQMRLLWDEPKNKQFLNLKFSDVTTKDNKTMAFWICNFEGRHCNFRKTPKQVYQAIYNRSPVCDICNELPYEKSIVFKAPERVEEYWDHSKNRGIDVYPEYTPAYSNNEIFVRCKEHNWTGTQVCSDLIKHIPCPYCNGKKATLNKNLLVAFPDIAKTLHPNYDPKSILPFSSHEYEWWCNECNEFYKKAVRLRTSQNQGCPNHTINSITEQLLRQVLNHIFGGFIKHYLKNVQWKSNGNRVEIDIYQKVLLVGIEYDGLQHGSEKQMLSDQEKNNMLVNSNEVSIFIRIREEGLPKLVYHKNQHEIICGKHEYTYKFLIPAIQKILILLKQTYNLAIGTFSDEDLHGIIMKIRPTINRTDYSQDRSKMISSVAPALLRYISEKHKYLSYGSNEIVEIKCPRIECHYEDMRTVRNFIKSKGLCKGCLYFVKDILDPNSDLVRWHPRFNTL